MLSAGSRQARRAKGLWRPPPCWCRSRGTQQQSVSTGVPRAATSRTLLSIPLPSMPSALRLAAGKPDGLNRMLPACITPSGTATTTRRAVKVPLPATATAIRSGREESMAMTCAGARAGAAGVVMRRRGGRGEPQPRAGNACPRALLPGAGSGRRASRAGELLRPPCVPVAHRCP